ncbi:MAG: protein-export chaperone SecB [Hyphomicrobiaceae bacterium]
MSDTSRPDGVARNGAATAPVQVGVVAQFIKDLSFELPNVERVIGGPGQNPNLKVEVNVTARKIQDNRFESLIEFRAHASDQVGTIYDLELIYGGLFDIQSLPQDALEPFLLINCPALLFPFLRRIVADVTRESGFPPLLLDPIDFGQLYMRRRQEAMAARAGATA